MKRNLLLVPVAVLAVFSAAGCSERTEEAARETSQNTARDAERNTEGAGQSMERAAEGAGATAKNTAQTVVWTAKVKSALYADNKIAGYRLNVDSDGRENHVTITGTVPTQAEKQRVTQIAKKTLGGGAVITNNVKVTGS